MMMGSLNMQLDKIREYYLYYVNKYLTRREHDITGKPIMTIDKNGNKVWRINGNGPIHREDGPAIDYADGTKEWRLNGERHREDGPAVWFYGHKEYWLNGKEVTEEEHMRLTNKKDIKIWYKT